MNLRNNQKRIVTLVVILFAFITLSSFRTTKAAVANTINFQSKMIVKATGLNLTAGTPPACVVFGADTCDFRVRIWNQLSGGTATAGNNLMFEELFTNVELGDTNGIFNLLINSICVATTSGTHAWGTTVTAATICNLFDDNGDVDVVTGVNFDRTDLYLEVTFDPSGAWTSLASPPGGIETFARTNMASVPTAYTTQSLGGFDETGFVQLSPTGVQNTNSSTGGIRVNQAGSGDILKLERTVGGQNALSLNNAGQLAVGSSLGYILFGGDVYLYRSSSTTLRTDGNFIMDGNSSTQLTVLGLTILQGNTRAVVTVANGSTTTTGTGSSLSQVTVSSTTNFDVGNLILINGTTYAVITSIENSTLMSVNPTVTWTAGQTVVEYTAPKIGGDGTTPTLMFDRLSSQLGLRVGTSTNSTSYKDQLLTTSNNLSLDSPQVNVNTTGSTVLNTVRGLIINKVEGVNATQAWSSAEGILTTYALSAVNYNGKVYLFGGQDNGGNIFGTLYSYDYATDVWKLLATGTQRTQHTAVVYNNKMYVWGGYNNVPAIVNTMDVYDFATNTWSAGTAGGTARGEPSGVVYKDKMYVWGAGSASFDVYDFAAGSWSTLATTSGASPNGATIAVYNDKIYLIGGDTGNFTKIWSFDFRTNVWTQLTSSTLEKSGHTVAIYDNKLYTFAGIDSASAYQNTVGIYDFAKDSWTTGVAGGTTRKYFYTTVYNGKAYNFSGVNAGGILTGVDIYDFGVNDFVLSLKSGDKEKLVIDQNNVMTLSTQPLGLKYIATDPGNYSSLAWGSGLTGGTARQFGYGVEYGGKIYNWGGANQAIAALTTVMDIYDIRTNTWTTGASGGTARWGTTGIVYNAKIYYFTGCSTTGGGCATTTTIVDIYDIASNTWTTGTSGGTSRGLASIVEANGKVYVWGGFAAAVNVNTLDIYDLATNTWSTGLAGGTARRFVSGVVYKNKIYQYGGFIAASSNIMDIYDIQTNSWQTGLAGGTARRSYYVSVFRDRIYYMHGNTTVGVNTVDIYNPVLNTWSVGVAGGSTNFGGTFATYNNKVYLWGGSNTGATAVTNTLDILDFGSTKAEDIFYLTNGGTGPENGRLFRFDSTGKAYTGTQGGWYSVGADYAEYMHTNDTTIEAGDIVKLDPGDGKSILRAGAGEEFIGVISTDPGFVGNITNIEDINNNKSDMKLLSMVGQVPVKVTGEINVGDKITISDFNGVGRKAEDGEDTLGIAQESHTGNTIGKVSVLITRNNEGINNKVQLKMGKKGEQGFRLSSAGKLQIKDEAQDWKDISDEVSVDSKVIWKKIGDNVYTNNTGVTSIGVLEGNLDSTKLQVGGDIEVKDGLKFLKLSAINQSVILNSAGIGFRLNNNSLEVKTESTGEWKVLSGLVQSNSIQKPDGTVEPILNSEQVSGWGFIKGDDNHSSLSKILSFGKNFSNVPVVIVDLTGSTTSEPENLNSCVFDNSIVTITPYSIDSSKFNLNVKIDGVSDSNKYYCFSWKALGN